MTPSSGTARRLHLPDLSLPATEEPRTRRGILGAVGHTPLVRLHRLFPGAPFRLWAKLEALNPGGSVKDRPALGILEDALLAGVIDGGTTVVEQSSGNMGIGLAQACGYLGLRFVCVVDAKTTTQNLRVLRAYGAEIEMVREPDAATGEFLPAKLARIQRFLAETENAFWPNQYENRGNPGSHYRSTMAEVAAALGGRVDYLFVGTSTCGTLLGCSEYARDHGMDTRLVAVDAVGSWIFGCERKKRLLPGLGAAVLPPFLAPSRLAAQEHVDDRDCVVGCRRLVAREAILAGGSSGGIVSAVARWTERIPEGANCVMVLPDRGERYLDTVYSDEWVHRHFGEIAHLWTDRAEPCLTTAC